MAKWVYQMTPHDQWDYDGINEMPLVDQKIDGKDRKTAGAFRPQRLRLHARPHQRRTAGRREIRSGRQLGDQDRHGQEQPELRPAELVDRNIRPKANGEDVNTKGICPAALGTKDEQPSAFSPETGLFYVPTNHVCMDYEPFRVSYTPGQPYVGATLSMYPPPGGRQHGQFHRLGRRPRARSSGLIRNSSRSGPALSRRPATSCSTARSKAI